MRRPQKLVAAKQAPAKQPRKAAPKNEWGNVAKDVRPKPKKEPTYMADEHEQATQEHGQAQEAKVQGQEPKEPEFGANDGLSDIAKKMFFIAEGIGEPVAVTHGTINSVTIRYPDNSLVTARFEVRRGDLGGVGTLPGTEEEKKTLNEEFKKAKKAKDEEQAAAEKRAGEAAAAAQKR